MKTTLPVLLVTALSLPAQDGADLTHRLAFKNGATLTVSHHHLSLAEGKTLERLMSEEEGSDRFRQIFNQQGFRNQIGGALSLSATTEFAGNELDAGDYHLSFRIDDDLVWHLVVLSTGDEEICAVPLDVAKGGVPQTSLQLQPVARDNATGEGRLHVQFGPYAAHVDFQAGEENEDSAASGNTNGNAPRMSHEFEHGGSSLTISYNQLTLGGGRNLKVLMSKGDRGDQMRAYYNDNYLPQFLDGKLETTRAINVGTDTLAAGEYGFTFRVGNDLSWQLVLTQGDERVCAVPLATAGDGELTSTRLCVLPSLDTAAHAIDLQIRYGPLAAVVPVVPGEAANAVGGAPTSRRSR